MSSAGCSWHWSAMCYGQNSLLACDLLAWVTAGFDLLLSNVISVVSCCLTMCRIYPTTKGCKRHLHVQVSLEYNVSVMIRDENMLAC